MMREGLLEILVMIDIINNVLSDIVSILSNAILLILLLSLVRREKSKNSRRSPSEKNYLNNEGGHLLEWDRNSATTVYINNHNYHSNIHVNEEKTVNLVVREKQIKLRSQENQDSSDIMRRFN